MTQLKPSHILVLVLLLFLTCNKKEVNLLEIKQQEQQKQVCFIKNANHGYGIIYNFSYDTQKLLNTLQGFSGFNKITYINGLPVKAENTFEQGNYITFDYDVQGAMTLLTFYGKDSTGKPFAFKSSITTNSKKQVERIKLALPIFDDVLDTSIEYDANSNIKKINLTQNGKTQTILENLSFDNKNAPYIATPFNTIMLYFVIFTSKVGAENTTYFINKNNVTAARIATADGNVEYSYKYEYNDKGFPVKTNITRKSNGKEENYQENFSYNCP